MLDINFIRENPQLVKDELKKRRKEDRLKLVDELISADVEWRRLKKLNDELRASRNRLTLEITQAKKQGKKVDNLVAQAGGIPKEIDLNDKKMDQLKERVDYCLIRMPNILHESVPEGDNENDNVEIKKVGKITKFNFELSKISLKL